MPENIRNSCPEEEVPALVDLPGLESVLPPLRTARLNRYVLQYMRANTFLQSAAVFSIEADVTEIPEDCDGLLTRFWIPLCEITPKAMRISTSNQGQETQGLTDTYMICSSSQPESSLGYNSGDTSMICSSSQPHISCDTNIACSSSQPQSSLGNANTSPPHALQYGTSVLDNSDFSLQTFMTVFKDAAIKIHTCHFSWDGKLLAYAGSKGLVSIWSLETRSHLASITNLPGLIADVRFQPNSYIFAASCSDGVIRCWDSTNVSILFREFRGHSNSVFTLDFLPSNPDILCSGDTDGEICLWSLGEADSILKFKVGVGIKNVRFHPNNDLLAVALGKNIMVFQIDCEKKVVTHRGTLEGHPELVKSICWDPAGRYLASVSRQCARVWMLSNNTWICCHELDSDNYTYESCLFHSMHRQLLMIGSYMHVHMWDFDRGSKVRNFYVPTSEIISSLACSSESGLIASAGRSSEVKLWKML